MGQGVLQKREALRDSVKMRTHETLNHSVIVTTERPLSLTDNGHGSCCSGVHWVCGMHLPRYLWPYMILSSSSSLTQTMRRFSSACR